MANRRTCTKPRWIVVCFLEILCVAVMCFGQEQDSRKEETKKLYDAWHTRWSFFGGSVIAVSTLTEKEAAETNSRQLVNLGLAFEAGISLEISYLGPAPANKLDLGRALFSTGFTVPSMIKLIKGKRFELPATIGYARMIGTGNAVNFGAGLDFIFSDYKGIRFEVRDYLKLSGRDEHNITFRIAFLHLFDD